MMFDNEKKVIPYRIKQARVSRGLSMVELSELVSVSKQAISQYEMGKNEPSKAILNSIAMVLKYPASFFYKPVSSINCAGVIILLSNNNAIACLCANGFSTGISLSSGSFLQYTRVVI